METNRVTIAGKPSLYKEDMIHLQVDKGLSFTVVLPSKEATNEIIEHDHVVIGGFLSKIKGYKYNHVVIVATDYSFGVMV